MRSLRKLQAPALFAFLLLALSTIACAQDGVSTAGAARTKYLSKLGIIPTSREVVVEDFINYPRHEIARPKAGEAVGVDVRWGSSTVSPDGDAILQVGFSTALAHDKQELRPLNLSVVIDKSGSMADDHKMERVKQALLKMVSQLRSTDVLSIVVFDANAQVLLPAEKVLDRERIDEIIRGIEPGSTTNLNAGLMLGYKEAMKHFREDATNRVILLTDGIANRGVTDPAEIAKASVSYNDRGVDLSTIGVGLDVNKDMLQHLAKSGRGLFHFIADSEDIEKVFVKELQSQISPVATEPNLTVEYGPGLKLEHVYGFEPRLGENSVRIKLDNMNSGMTEVVLIRFKARGEAAQLPVKVRLSYNDVDRGKAIEAVQKSSIEVGEGTHPGMLADSSVAKNYTIASLATAIKEMASDCEGQRYRQAAKVLNAAIGRANERYPSMEDEDIKRTMAIALKYQGVLNSESGLEDKSETEFTRAGGSVDTAPVFNLIPNGDFSQGNTGFSSDLSYLEPTSNNLWSAGYTVATSFNNPQLHTLLPSEPFEAPKRSNGNEQAYYANAGGSAALVLWKTIVRCKPNTTYRIRFQSISLNSGVEWVPTFEIRVNGERSDAQISGERAWTPISSRWDSKGARSATISIVRMPMAHNGGLIAIANIEMTPVE